MKNILLIAFFIKSCIALSCDTLTIDGVFAYELSPQLWTFNDIILRDASLIFLKNPKTIDYKNGIISIGGIENYLNSDKLNCFNPNLPSFDIDSMQIIYHIDSIPKYGRFDYFFNKINSQFVKVKRGKSEYWFRIIRAKIKLINKGITEEWYVDRKGKMIKRRIQVYISYSFDFIRPI